MRLLGPAPRFFRWAACTGANALFFDRVWPLDERLRQPTEPVLEALEHAREVCMSCPVRQDCLEWIAEDEAGAATENRHGVVAMLTPGQRWSLEKRGTLRSPCHGEVYAPEGFLTGELVCPTCLAVERIKPIPTSGDLWNKRHTTLARRVIAWLMEETEVGDQLPSPGRLADTWRVRRHDMVRVFQALVEDGTLAKGRDTEPPTYTRIADTSAATWRPRHLRKVA